jgi:hydrogenase small subunit
VLPRRTSLDVLTESVGGALAVIAVGSCAAFGGFPRAAPHPTGAVSVEHLVATGRLAQRPLINLPGCPPIGEASPPRWRIS